MSDQIKGRAVNVDMQPFCVKCVWRTMEDMQVGHLTIPVQEDQSVSKAVIIGGALKGWTCDKAAFATILHHNTAASSTEPTCSERIRLKSSCSGFLHVSTQSICITPATSFALALSTIRRA